jgi:hypothetical protein
MGAPIVTMGYIRCQSKRAQKVTPMAKIEVRNFQSTKTGDGAEPHFEAVVDYGEFEVTIPLPARCLATDDWEMQERQCVQAMESLAEALLEFAGGLRKRWP